LCITDVNGEFSLSLDAGNQQINISYIGYVTQKLNTKVSGGKTNNIGEIKLASDAVGINEVKILASVAVSRKTPVAASTIDPIQIAEKLGTQEYPEILKSTPGIYATRQGGDGCRKYLTE